MKKSFKYLIACGAAFVCFVAAFILFFAAGSMAKSSRKDSVEFRLEVPSGSSVKKISKVLKANKIIRSSTVLYVRARFGGFMLKSGVYTVDSSMNVGQILQLLNSGKQEYIRTVIPEGITKSKIGAILEENGVCSKEEFLNAVCDRELMASYKIDTERVLNFEGFLFPDTYFFSPSMSGKAVVKTMVDNFYEQVSEIEGLKEKSFDEFYRLLILSSVVECEFLKNSEAPLIASVFTNRVKYNLGLESCATINYIREEILGLEHKNTLNYEDTHIESDYNTYMWAALTMIPGPISNPGLLAIKSTVNPPKTNYLYFASKEDGSGESFFSATLEEHNENKLKMKRNRRKAAQTK